MVEARLGAVERERGVEDGPPVLDGRHTARGERAAVAQPLDGVEDGRGNVAGENEISVQRVARPVRVDGAAGGHEGLREHLPAVDARAADGPVSAPEDQVFDGLEVQQVQ